MSAAAPTVLVVERPGAFRDALASAIAASGASVDTSDDPLDALSRLGAAPDVLIVADDAGPPGGVATCRIARRKLPLSRVYLLLEAPTEGEPNETSTTLFRSAGTDAVAAAALGDAGQSASKTGSPGASPLAAEVVTVGPLGGGELLASLAESRFSGRLVLSTSDTERVIDFADGYAIFSRSSHPTERLGALALRAGKLDERALDEALVQASRDGARLGETLIARSILPAHAVFGLLGDQVVAQLAGACNAAASRARLFHAPNEVQTPVLRVHALTAVLAATEAIDRERLARLIEELRERALGERPLGEAARAWLRDVGVADPDALVRGPVTMGELCERLQAAMPEAPPSDASSMAEDDSPHDAASWSATLAMTLLRAGVVRVASPREDRTPSLRAHPSLDAVGLNAAIDRAAVAPLEALTRAPEDSAQSPAAKRLRDYLRASRPKALAKACALRGPSPEVSDPRLDGPLGVALQTLGRSRPREVLGVSDVASIDVIRARHAELSRHASPPQGSEGPLATLLAGDLSAALDHALSTLAETPAPTEPARPPPEPAPPSSDKKERAKTKTKSGSWKKSEAAPPPKREQDPRVAEIESLLGRGRWDKIATRLGPAETAADLPPELGLLYAIARKETASDGATSDVDALAIRSMSALLGVRAESPAALVIAKRTLRLPPSASRSRSPEATSISTALIFFILLLGSAIGLLLAQTGLLPF